MKSYTDLEQSKKLAEILPLESADMYYMETSRDNYTIGVLQRMETDMLLNHAEYYKISPCWSLASLLSIIPKYIGDSVFRMDMGETDINLWFDDLSSRTVDEVLPDITKENFVDAAFEMILKLKEKDLL